eukprot:augustus_masked-scaffold_9-processed-gene-7.19-mRNA-1 protein AED:1.00 eAED:1.00 QI:0/0/0/0/1/1/2/0/729
MLSRRKSRRPNSDPLLNSEKRDLCLGDYKPEERERIIRLETIRRKQKMKQRQDSRKRIEENERTKSLELRRRRIEEGSRYLRRNRPSFGEGDELDTFCDRSSIYTRSSIRTKSTFAKPKKLSEIILKSEREMHATTPKAISNVEEPFDQDLKHEKTASTSTNLPHLNQKNLQVDIVPKVEENELGKENCSPNKGFEFPGSKPTETPLNFQQQSVVLKDARSYIKEFRTKLEKNQFFNFNNYNINVNCENSSCRNQVKARSLTSEEELELIFNPKSNLKKEKSVSSSLKSNCPKEEQTWDTSNLHRNEMLEEQKTLAELRRKEYAAEVNARNLRTLETRRRRVTNLMQQEQQLQKEILELNERLAQIELVNPTLKVPLLTITPNRLNKSKNMEKQFIENNVRKEWKKKQVEIEKEVISMVDYLKKKSWKVANQEKLEGPHGKLLSLNEALLFQKGIDYATSRNSKLTDIKPVRTAQVNIAQKKKRKAVTVVEKKTVERSGKGKLHGRGKRVLAERPSTNTGLASSDEEPEDETVELKKSHTKVSNPENNKQLKKRMKKEEPESSSDEESDDEPITFAYVWKTLKKLRFGYASGDLIHNYYYLYPGVKTSEGVMGKTKFTEDGLIEYYKKNEEDIENGIVPPLEAEEKQRPKSVKFAQNDKKESETNDSDKAEEKVMKKEARIEKIEALEKIDEPSCISNLPKGLADHGIATQEVTSIDFCAMLGFQDSYN